MRVSTSSVRRIASLDGLRAVSIGLVLWAHWCETPYSPNFLHVFPARFLDFIGSLGVSVFFVISGFLITTLLINEKERFATIRLRDFYIRRVLRIFPAYYAYLLALGLLAVFGWIAVPAGDFIASALFVRDYYPHTTFWTNHPWSLAVEEQFYLLWPLLVLKLDRKRLVTISVVLIVALPIVRLCSYAAIPQLRDLIPIMFHTRVDTILFGCLLALTRSDLSLRRLQERTDALHAPAIAAVVLCVISPALFAKIHYAYLLTIGYTIDNICIAIILLWAVDHERSAFGRFLNWRPIVVVGTLSYSLYLWHVLFIGSIGGYTLWFPINLIATFAAAWISFQFIEKPFNGLRHRFGSAGVDTEAMPAAIKPMIANAKI